MEVKQLARKFGYNGVSLDDPDPAMSPLEVRDFYSAVYPEIVSASVEGPEESSGNLTYTFRRAVGTKG